MTYYVARFWTEPVKEGKDCPPHRGQSRQNYNRQGQQERNRTVAVPHKFQLSTHKQATAQASVGQADGAG